MYPRRPYPGTTRPWTLDPGPWTLDPGPPHPSRSINVTPVVKNVADGSGSLCSIFHIGDARPFS